MKWIHKGLALSSLKQSAKMYSLRNTPPRPVVKRHQVSPNTAELLTHRCGGSPYSYDTPVYDVSPGTVQFMKEYYRQLCSPTVETKPVEIASVQPGHPSLYSPGTEEYLVVKYVELFGASPTPNMLSPIQSPPYLSINQTKTANHIPTGIIPIRPHNAPSSVVINTFLRPVTPADVVPVAKRFSPKPATSVDVVPVAIFSPKRFKNARRHRKRMCMVYVDGKECRMSRGAAWDLGLIRDLKTPCEEKKRQQN